MFLDIRVTLATFVAAIGLALVMLAVGTRAWVGGHDRPTGLPIEARALAAPDPVERGFGVSSASARSATAPLPTAALPSASIQSFLPAPKAEPAGTVERIAAREAPPTTSNSVMPGAGAVVQDRFDVLHEPAAQLVSPRSAAGGPLVPLPRPRTNEPSATTPVTSASIAGTERAADPTARPQTAVGSAKRTDTSAAKKRQKQTTGYFGGLFGGR